MGGIKKSYEQIRQEVAQKVKTEQQQKEAANAASSGNRKSYEQIRSEVAKKHGITLQPVTPKTPTMQELADQADLEYRNYVDSEEYQKAVRQYNAEHKWDGVKNALMNTVTGGSFGLPGLQAVDPKERELKAKVDYYKQQAQLEADNAVMEAARKEWESWDEADRAALELYANNRLGSLGNIAGTVSAISSGSGTQQGQAAILAGQVNDAYEQLRKKYGSVRVKELAESYERYQNQKATEEVTEATQEAASGDGTAAGKWGAGALHSGLSVGANLVNAMTGPVGVISELSHRTGQYSTLDPNNMGNILGTYAGAVRGQVAENISGDKYDILGNKVSDGGVLRQVGATLYEAGMSSADSLARIFASGGNEAISLGLAATGSFSQTVSQASRQGANPVQAVAMGVLDGGLEVLTEKVSLDNLFKTAAAGPKNFGQIVKGILKSGAIEVSEEEMSFIGSTLLEAAILREKSSYNQQVQQLVMNGQSWEQAKKTADRSLLEEAVNTAVTSFLSGGMMGGGAQVVSAYQTSQIGKDFEKLNLDQAGIQDLVDIGLESAPDTESHQIATEIQQQIDEGRTPSNYELARLWQANWQASWQAIAEEETRKTEKTAIPTGETAGMSNSPGVAAEGQNGAQTGQSVIEQGQNVINQGKNVTVAGPSVTANAGNATAAPLSIAEQIRQNRVNQGGMNNGTGEIAGTAGEAGAGVLSGSGQRTDGAGAGEPTGGMAGGAGQAAQGDRSGADRFRTQSQRADLRKNLSLEKVSPRELGIQSGVEDKNLRVIPEEMQDSGMREKADQIYEETGQKVTYVLGPIRVKIGGRMQTVKGVRTESGIVVRADHRGYTPEQIADHESYHERVVLNPGDQEKISELLVGEILNEFSEEELSRELDRYMLALREIHYPEGTETGEEEERLSRLALEELLADAYAGINSFGGRASRFSETVRRSLRDNYILGWSNQEQANGVRETAGPPSVTAENKNTADDGGDRYSFHGYADDGKGIYKSNFPKGTPKRAKGERVLRYIQDVWSKKPITLRIETDSGIRYIEAQFDPTFDEGENVRTDASKLMGGNRHGTSAEQRVTLDLADDYYQLASEARYNGSKEETGKETLTHQGVKMWHYFVNDIYFAEYGSNELLPYTVSINVKEKADGNFFYSFSAEKNGEPSTQRTLHAAVNSNNEAAANRNLSTNSIAQQGESVKDNSEDYLNMTDEEFQERYGLKLRAVDEDTAPGGERFSYAGEHARTANSQTLGEAKGLELMGVDAETIRQETGWFRGRDGKWRFEVDDSTAQVADEIINYMTLGELLPGAEIFKAYPEMKNISVVFQSLDPGVNAQYNRQFDHIDVSYKLKNDPDGIKSAVLHEIQHAIQNREGFTKGSTVGSWDKRIKAGFDSRKASDIREAAEAERKLEQFRMEDPELYRDMMELDAMAPDLPRGAMNWDTLEQIEEDPPEWQAYDARRDELEEIYGDRMWDFNSALYDLQRINKRTPRTAEELYWDTAGEIEARNVAGRRNLTAEQRKKTPPILGGEDTVFAEGDGRSHQAIGKTADNRPFVTIDGDILAGVPRRDWVKTVTDNLKKRFPSGVTVGKNLIAVDKQSRQEMTFSKYTRWLMNNDPSLYEDKLRATNNIDEIIQASTDWVNEGLNHSRKDTITDFARGIVLIDVGGRKYSAEVVVGTKKNGTMIMYDLLKMTPAQFAEKETDMAITANPSPEADRSTMSISKVSIAQSGYSVKDNADARYSVDDGSNLTVDDFARVQAALKGTQQSRNEQFLRDRLGEEGYEQYRKWEKEKQLEERLDAQKRQRERTRERQAQRREAVKNTPKPKDESKPTQAKRELRGTVMDLFSVLPEARKELGGMIDSFADRLIRKEMITEEDRQAFFDRLYEAGAMKVPADDYFRLGRELVKDGKVFVPESVRADFGDDWNSFRARAFGAGITITYDRNAAPGIDTWNQELASEIPGLFDENETDLRSILERIVEVAEEGRDEMMSLADYTAMLADRGDITEDEFLDQMERQLEEALRTFAKQARLEVRLKDRSKYQIAKERAVHREMQERQQERKNLREMQKATLKRLQWLKKNQRRAPEELKKEIDEVLSDLNIYTIHAAKGSGWSEKYNATWEDIVDVYKTAKAQDPNFFEIEELERMAKRLDGVSLDNLDVEALEDIYKLAVGIQTTMQNRDKVLNDEHDRRIKEVFADSREELRAAGGKITTNMIREFFNENQLTPMNIFQRMGGWNPNGAFFGMMKELERGERIMRAYQVKAQRILEQFMNEHRDYVKWADGQGKDGIWYEVEIPELLALEVGKKPQYGKTVKVYMTSAQKVHLYLESRHPQNMRHIAKGGRTFVDKELYQKGDRKQAFAMGTTVRMSPETVKELVSNLTEEELELARLLDQYYNTMAPAEINAVSNEMYGYDKAMGGFYAPIFTNNNYVKDTFGVFDGTAEGVSNLKERLAFAGTPTYNISCFEAFERNVAQTARFVGMAIPIRNVSNLLNVQGKDTSMREVIEQTWRTEGYEYIKDVMNDLQGNAPAGKKDERKKNVIERFVGKVQDKYIQTTFGGNASIVLKQVGSLPLASAYLGWKNVLPAPGLVHRTDINLINRYTQDLAWRTMGYSMPETKMLKDNPNWTETNKFYKFTFGGGAITAMDGAVAKVLWPWAENKVRNEFPELEMGTQEQIEKGESPFYKKVAEEFNDAVARSQSTTDATHQSEMRKSTSEFARAFTMFRSDSAQTYNALRQKMGEAQYYGKEIKRRKEYLGKQSGEVSESEDPVLQELEKNRKSAAKAVGNVVGAMVMNAMWSEVVTFLWALLRHKHKRYKDEEGELSWESVSEEMVSGMLGSMAGIVAGGEEVFEIIGNLLTGEKWYEIESLGLAQVNALIETVTESAGQIGSVIAGWTDVAQNEGDVGQYWKENWRDMLGGIKTVAETVATYAGEFPVKNVEAALMGAFKWVCPELGAAYDDLWQNIDKDDLTGLTGGALEGRIGRILSDRSISEDSNTAQMLAELYEEGRKRAVPGKIPTSVTVDGETHKLDEAIQNRYSETWSAIVGDSLDELVSSKEFREVDSAGKEKMLNYLYNYAAEMTKAELFEGYEPDTRDDSVQAFQDAEMTMTQFLSAYAKYSEINGKDQSATQKATEFARWVDSQTFTPHQEKIVKEEFTYYNMAPASSGKYDEMVEAGLDEDAAYDLANSVSELEPEAGTDEVSDLQKWRHCIDFFGKEASQLAALCGYMTDAQFQKVNLAYDFGVKPETYVTMRETLPRFDADSNGQITQAEAKTAIDTLDISSEEKAVLWQLTNTGWSAKNNPYSRDVGQKVLDARAEAKAKSGT